MSKNIIPLLSGVVLTIFLAAGADPASAQSTDPSAPQPKIVGIISGGIGGTYARFAQNLADALDSNSLRIIPMLGRGSQQNIKDLLVVNGIDIAIVQSDVLDHYKDSGEIKNVEASIRYIAKLYNEEIHIVAKQDLHSIKALEGAAVGVGRKGSGTEMTANTLFKALGISIKPVNAGTGEALEGVKSGTLKAFVYVVGKPGSALSGIKAEDGLKLVPISLGKSVQGAYFPTSFTHEDYPNLVPEGSEVPTAAVGAVMAMFNWKAGTPRYEAVAEFAEGLAGVIDLMKEKAGTTYHAKWKAVDLTTEVPGWTRFQPAAELMGGQ